LAALKNEDPMAARAFVTEEHQAELEAQADGPFDVAWPISNLRIGRPQPDKSVSSARKYKFVVRVPTEFELPKGAVPTLGSGQVSWDFYLARDGANEAWRISEEGRG
jgi:hypothetical protein